MPGPKHPRPSCALFLVIALVACGGHGDGPGDGGSDTGSSDTGSSDTGPRDSTMSDSSIDGATCPSGRTLCGDSCVDLSSDDGNCGGCGLICGDSSCNAGRCDASCPTDTVGCGFRCCPLPAGCDMSGATCALPPPVCPTDPPSDGTACGAPQSCLYPRCDSVGEVRATCVSGTWTVITEACSDVICAEGSMTCSAEELCVATAGGALMIECRVDPCGGGTVEAACACDVCPSGAECTVIGRNITCNTCPSGLCP